MGRVRPMWLRCERRGWDEVLARSGCQQLALHTRPNPLDVITFFCGCLNVCNCTRLGGSGRASWVGRTNGGKQECGVCRLNHNTDVKYSVVGIRRCVVPAKQPQWICVMLCVFYANCGFVIGLTYISGEERKNSF